MDTNTNPDILSVLTNIETVLNCILGVVFFATTIGIGLLLQTRNHLKVLAKSREIKQFEAQASVMLSEAQYPQLKDLCFERLQSSPGDATAYYYYGMAHLRCHEYVEAKRRFDSLVKLDATWGKVASSHIEAIEAALKKAKPVLVDGDQ